MTENFKWQFSSDPEEFTTALSVAAVDVTATGRGPYLADVAQVRLKRIWLQLISTSFPRVEHIVNKSDRIGFNFRPFPAAPRLIGTAELSTDTILRYSPNQAFFERIVGPVAVAAMSVSADDLSKACENLRQAALPSTSEINWHNTQPSALAELRRLHAATIQLLDHAPELLAHGEAMHGLEEELLYALISCLALEGEERPSLAIRRHALVMKRFYAVIQEQTDHEVYVSDVCKATGVSINTLRACCQEALGMGPMRYLWLRRMHKVRRTLSMASPQTASVTAVATAHGFWELGRFSVEYRKLFGEGPMTTLQRRF